MITVDYLKTQIKEYNFEVLTGGNDAVAQSCIQNADLAIRAALRSCGVEPDYTDDIDTAALTRLSLYELYSYAENEAIAADKRRDAFDLLRGKYGNCVGKGLIDGPKSNQKMTVDPVGYIKKGSDNWKGFR